MNRELAMVTHQVGNMSLAESDFGYSILRPDSWRDLPFPWKPVRGWCRSALEHQSHGSYYVDAASFRLRQLLYRLPLEAFEFDLNPPEFGRLKVVWKGGRPEDKAKDSPHVVYRLRRCFLRRSGGEHRHRIRSPCRWTGAEGDFLPPGTVRRVGQEAEVPGKGAEGHGSELDA